MLVATDVAARGIHVDDIAIVVHVDPPAEHKAYTHRSGRTARAGASGVVVTLQTSAQRSEVAAMTRRAGIKPTVISVSPGSSAVSTLTGPRAAHVTPGPVQAEPRNGGGNGRGQRSGDNDGRRRGGNSRKPSTQSASSSRPARSGGSRSQGSKPAARSMSASEFSSGGRRGR